MAPEFASETGHDELARDVALLVDELARLAVTGPEVHGDHSTVADGAFEESFDAPAPPWPQSPQHAAVEVDEVIGRRRQEDLSSPPLVFEQVDDFDGSRRSDDEIAEERDRGSARRCGGLPDLPGLVSEPEARYRVSIVGEQVSTVGEQLGPREPIDPDGVPS